MERRVDEEEHSGEMQYPYIKKIINDVKESSGMQYDIKVLPIMAGSIGTGKEESIGKLISPLEFSR
jgi:predicted class III extradiol MEMO1 family dioxygenase